MTPEQRIIDALYDSDRSHMSGVTVGDLIECDSCGEQFPHWGRWLYHRGQASATAALDAVRDALTSDDPQVVGAMAERVGLTVDATVTIEPGGEFPHWTASPPSVRVDRRRWVTPWREVPDA